MMLSKLSTDSTVTDSRIPKFNLCLESFKGTDVFIFAWSLIPKKKHSACVTCRQVFEQLTSIGNYCEGYTVSLLDRKSSS